jgi:hypothetical protein
LPNGFGGFAVAESLANAASSRFPYSELRYALAGVLQHRELQAAIDIDEAAAPQNIAAWLADSHSEFAVLWQLLRECRQRYGAIDIPRIELVAESRPSDSMEAWLWRSFRAAYAADTVVDVITARALLARILEHACVYVPTSNYWSTWRENCSPQVEANLVLADLQTLQREIDGFREGPQQQGPYTTAEFQQLVTDHEELITNVLVATQLALVGAPTKSLKTMVMLDAAISLATGTPWLNHPEWSVPRIRRVGFYSAESGPATLLHKHRLIAVAKRQNLLPNQWSEFDQSLESNLFWNDKVPDLSDVASMERFRCELERHQLDVVIVDPLSMAIGAAAKDLANMAVAGQVILNAADICRRANATLVVVHHTAGDRQRMTSGRARGPLELGDIGYPAVTNHARQWLTLNRAEAYDEQERRNELWLRIGGSGMQVGGTFRVAITEGLRHDRWEVHVEGEAARIARSRIESEQRASERDLETHRSVIEFLRQHPESSLNRMTRSGLGIGRTRLQAKLVELQSRGVVRVTDRRGGRYYSIV